VSGLYASNPLPTIVAGLQTGSLSLFPTVGAALSEQQALGPRAFAGAATPGVGRDLFYGVTNTTIYTPAENLIFKNIAAIRVTKELSSIDYSDTGLGILTLGGGTNTGWNEDSIQYTNELQIQGRAFQRLSWIAGSFLSLNQPLKATNEPSIQLGTEDFYHFHNSGSSEAAFIHGIYDFGDYVHGLHMSAGYRYTFDQVSIHEFGYKGVDMVQAAAGGAPTNCAPIIFNDSCDAGANAHFSSPGWNLGLDEQVNKTALVYVRSGNAYRPGNVNPEAPASYQLVKPEHVTDVEVGAKLDWRVLGGRARLNGDLYYTKYKSIQVVQDVSVPDPNNPDAPPTVAAVATNNAMAYLAGTEVETTWRSPQGFEINAHASYIYSHYNQYPALFYATQVPPFLFEPAWQYGATATYHLPLPRSAGDVSVAGTYAFTGREFAAANTADSNNVIASHDNSNIRIDWITPFQPNLETSLVITNVFNKVYITSIAALYDVIGITSASYDEPRMVVFYVKYRFGPYR
jgi:hypothetical protein